MTQLPKETQKNGGTNKSPIVEIVVTVIRKWRFWPKWQRHNIMNIMCTLRTHRKYVRQQYIVCSKNLKVATVPKFTFNGVPLH